MKATFQTFSQSSFVPAVGAMRVLFAYDGSEHAEAALQLLQDLPLYEGSTILALSVLPTQWISGHEALRAALDRIPGRFTQRNIQVTTELKAGNPAATINDTARLREMNLIVMGAKGLRATLGILLGGVAQQVVEYAQCPVLIVRAPYKGIKKVLVVTDGSKHSQLALEYLAPLCAPDREHPDVPPMRKRCCLLPESAEVHVMHILPPSIPPEAAMSTWAVGPEVMYPVPAKPIDRQAIEAEEHKAGQQLLSQALHLMQEGGISARGVLKRGDAATEILEYSRAHDIDLIVCGSRGLSPVASWLLGSVSRKLVHYATCSVLVVRAAKG